MKTYDVYIANTEASEAEGEHSTSVRQSRSWNPDDAIQKLRDSGDFIPEKGDRVVRCVEVNRELNGQ